MICFYLVQVMSPTRFSGTEIVVQLLVERYDVDVNTKDSHG